MQRDQWWLRPSGGQVRSLRPDLAGAVRRAQAVAGSARLEAESRAVLHGVERGAPIQPATGSHSRADLEHPTIELNQT
jgi:hypothetical protein